MFEFKGDWRTKISLKAFSILNNPEYYRDTEPVTKGLFNLEIFDVRNENPDPETYQMNTINYLENTDNQKQILTGLLNYCRDTIYPHYKEFMLEEEYPESYPKLESEKDLHQLLGINNVIIKRIDKDGFAYYILDCSSCLDYEHGINLTLYKNSVIDHGEDWDDQKVCEHKGIDYQTYHEKSVEEYNRRDLVLTQPHPKYGKLKPYQEEQNEYYPFGLYHDGQFDKLITELENGVIANAESVMARLLPLSIFHEKENITKYLLPKFGKGQHASFKYALQKDRFDLMETLIVQGYDINEQVAQDSSFYATIREIVNCLNKNEQYDHISKRLKFLLANGLNPMLEDKFGRNAYFAIERINNSDLKERVTKIVSEIIKSA